MGLGSKGKQTTTQNTVSEPWSAAQPTLRRALDGLNTLYDSGSLQPDPFGPMLAPESPYSAQARDMMGTQAAAGNPITAPTQAAYGGMVSGTGYSDLGRVKESIMRDVLPSVAQQFSNAGMRNSSIAGQGMAEAATRALAPIEYDNFNRAEGRRLSAMSMAPQMADLGYHDSRMLGTAGALGDARAQAELDDAAQLYYQTEDQDFNELQRLSQMAMGFGGMGGTSSGTQTSGRSMGIGGIIGAGMSLLPMLGFSDRRLKENIEKVGETDVKVPLYTYNYKGDITPQIGVMADEMPMSMVHRHPSGFDMVDYAGVL